MIQKSRENCPKSFFQSILITESLCYVSFLEKATKNIKEIKCGEKIEEKKK